MLNSAEVKDQLSEVVTMDVQTENQPVVERLQFFLDTSGSTHGNGKYYERAKIEFEKVSGEATSEIEIEIFEWGSNCVRTTSEDMKKALEIRKSVRASSSGTNFLKVIENIHTQASTVVIVTDGEIHESNFTSAAQLLKQKLSSVGEGNKEPKIRLIVQGTLDMSAVLALGSASRDFEFAINDEPMEAVKSVVKHRDDLISYVDAIDLDSYILDADYKRRTDLGLRLATVDCSDDELIKQLLQQLNRLKRKTLAGVSRQVEIDTRGIEDALKDALNDSSIDFALSLLKQELDKHNSIDGKCFQVDRAVAQLSTIVNNCKNRSTLYFSRDATVAKSQVPETIVYYDDNHDKLPPGTIECFFTSQVGVPYASFILDEPLTVNKNLLDQLVINPLVISSLCKLETALGSFFVNHPSRFIDGRDPRTRKHLFDADGTARVLALGVEPDHIKYTDQILCRVLFNDYKVVDLDLVFLAIWYQIKYKSSRDDLKENIGCFEEQLKARFEKMSPLSLNSSVFECSKYRAKKWICIWFIVHELAHFKQHDQNHTSTIRFLSHVHILVAFLRDIYNIRVRDDLQTYHSEYLALKQLIRCQNTSDKDEFWRRVRALKTESLAIDTSKSIVKLGVDLNVTKQTGEVCFGEGKASITAVVENRRANIVTIPLDEPRKSAVPDELLEFFPASCRQLDVDKLAWLSLHVFNPRETLLMFNNDEANRTAQEKNIRSIGFDPRVFKPVWAVHKHSDTVKIHPSTLRPRLVIADGRLWTNQAQENIGEGSSFVSFHALMGEFISKYRKLPTIDEMILFVYKCERQKTIEVLLIRGEIFSCPRGPNKIFTLQKDINKWGAKIIADFEQVFAEQAYTIDEAIRRFKVSMSRSQRMEMEKEGDNKLAISTK